jgi:hypothetical protein
MMTIKSHEDLHFRAGKSTAQARLRSFTSFALTKPPKPFMLSPLLDSGEGQDMNRTDNMKSMKHGSITNSLVGNPVGIFAGVSPFGYFMGFFSFFSSFHLGS